MTARFAHLSGHPALDVINTVDWRLNPERQIEQLESFGDVLAWSTEGGFITDDEADTLAQMASDMDREAACQGFVAMRELAYRTLYLRDVDASRSFTALANEAFGRATLTPAAPAWTWHDKALTLATPQDRVVRGLAALMQDPIIERLHQCEDVDCGWIFLDTSRRGNRRWCASSDCGDRNRARAYYRRNHDSIRSE